MIEKALIIIIACYISSFAFLGVQLTIGDIIDVEMGTYNSLSGSFTGTDFRTAINSLTSDSSSSSTGGTGASYTQLGNGTYIMTQLDLTDSNAVTSNPIATAASVAFTIFQLMTGTYIFDILIFLGIPPIFVAGIVMIYVILLSRTVIAYLRGI